MVFVEFFTWRRGIVPRDSLGNQTPARIWPRPGLPEAEGSELFGTSFLLRVLLPPEQPAAEDQQVSNFASPTEVILAAGDVVHPGLTFSSSQVLVAFGAIMGHDITIKDIS
jgi:hypothetical protein